MGNIFLENRQARRSSGNIFARGRSGKEKDDDLDARLDELEALAAASGARAPDQDKPGLFRRTVDVLSRPNYAVAGAVEEIINPTAEGPLARSAREFFSGVGGMKGEKRGFGQVLERAGVPTGGSLSGIAPFLYSETGEGLPLQRGGGLDPTARGFAGFALDVFADPTTYVTAGAKGIKFAGAALPGTEKAFKVMRSAANSAVKSVPAFDTAINALGSIAYRDWKIRNLPGAIRLKQAHLNRETLRKAELYERIGNSAISQVPKRRWTEFIDALEDGTWAAKFKDEPVLVKAAEDWKGFNKEWADAELAAGMIKPERVVDNYVAHFYENNPDDLIKIKDIWPRLKLNNDNIGRHAEARGFNTLKQAEEFTKAQHALDPRYPILRPVRNPLEILRRRGDASIEALEFRRYYDEIAEAFGRPTIPTKAAEFQSLLTPVAVTPSEAKKIGALVSAGKTPIETFRSLSASGQKEFVRSRLLASKDPKEIIAVLNKYGVDATPKQRSLLGTFADDGSPYVAVRTERLAGVEIPKSLADDLADMSERTWKSKELDHLLRWFDKPNNVFKTSVTVLFPAFHFRNAYSNLAQGFADVGASVLNPARHWDAYHAMRGSAGALRTKAGEMIPYAQIRQEMLEQNVLTTGRRILEHTGTPKVERLATVAGKVKAAPRKAGQIIENEARAALYTIYRRRGMDAVTAGERVNLFLFDYSNLSRVERDFFKRGIPFYTWTRKNLERQFRNITTKPGKTLTPIKAFRGRDEENGMMTSWEGEALKLRLNRDGKTVRIISGVDLPIKSLDLVWNGSMRGTIRQQLGMVTPLLKGPLEIGAGASFFTGRPMDRATSTGLGRTIEALDPPQKVQDWLGYKKEHDAAGRPRYTFDGERFYVLFQSWALSRLVSTTDRQFRVFADDPNWATVMLDLSTGLRYKELNLDEEQDKRLKERVRQLEESLRRRGEMRSFEKTYRPKSSQGGR